MRVLVIPTESGSDGGTFRFLERLLNIHAANDIITALLVPGRQSPAFTALAARFCSKVYTAYNSNTPATPPLLTPFGDLLFSWRAVREWRPQLIVVSTAEPGRMTISLFYPMPVLYALHTTPDHQFRVLPRLYLRLGVLFNNMVMTVSHASAKATSLNMGISLKKIAVVHNSCRAAAQGNTDRGPLVLTAGHVVAYKNPETWLAVAEMVVRQRPDVRFLWLGDGDQLVFLREKVAALGLDERVIFHGHTSDPSFWYTQAQVYFQPSLRESHGIAVLEAMAHGLPCVVADTGGLPESVVDSQTGFIRPPADVAGFADCILDMLGDPALRDRMGAAGRLRVERYFSETEQERKIIALYDRLMKKTEKK